MVGQQKAARWGGSAEFGLECERALALAVAERQRLARSRLLRGGFGFSPSGGGGVDAPAVVVASRLTFGLAGNGRFEALDA